MKHSLFPLAPLALLLAGCMATPQDTVSPQTGAALFAENCAACHGSDARGTGPLATRLDTAPADLTRIASRRDGVWPQLEIMSIIDGYTKRTDTPRGGMPVMSSLTEGPVVEFDTGNGQITRAPARLLSVARYLESIQAPPPSRYVP